MADRQYIECTFKPGGRGYTYHNDAAPVAVGDRVIVATDRGEQAVSVVALVADKPPYATKGIVRMAEQPPAEERTELEDRDDMDLDRRA